MKVLLVDESEERAARLRDRLNEEGCAVLIDLGLGTVPLVRLIARYQPDVVLIDTLSPARAVFSDLLQASMEEPRPVVLLMGDADAASAREAVVSGAHALVFGDSGPARLLPVLEAARAQFEAMSRLRSELVRTQQQLVDRKIIDRAKGILMKQRGLDESEVYHLLRRMAMEKKVRIAQVAEHIVGIADLLQAGSTEATSE